MKHPVFWIFKSRNREEILVFQQE